MPEKALLNCGSLAAASPRFAFIAIAAAKVSGEHMTSFDYAYKLEAVRDWLFAQRK